MLSGFRVVALKFFIIRNELKMIPSLNKYESLNKNSIKVLKIYDREDNEKFVGDFFMEVRYDQLKDTSFSNKNCDANIAIYFSRIGENPTKEISFKAWYDDSFIPHFGKRTPTICLTNDDVIIRDNSYKGLRLGTLAFSYIVLWAKQFPDANIKKIRLSHNDAVDENNKKRRNQLYEKIGLKFEYSDLNAKSGTSIDMPACSLVEINSWNKFTNPATGNIEIIDVDDFVKKLSNDMLKIERENKDLIAKKERYESWVIIKIINKLKL